MNSRAPREFETLVNISVRFGSTDHIIANAGRRKILLPFGNTTKNAEHACSIAVRRVATPQPGKSFAVHRSMLAKVANDRHQCKGNVIYAVCWGAFWATLYTAPLALLVWVVHLVQAKAVA